MSNKADLRLSRTMLINTGNYNNCTSVVDVTLKDVPSDRLFLISNTLSNVLDSILANECIHLIDESVTSQKNPNAYYNMLVSQKEKIFESGKENMKKLSTILSYNKS